MAIINALIPSASADVVAIFPEGPTLTLPATFGGLNLPGLPDNIEIPGFIPVQVFAGARPMRATISEPSQFMTHPLESGAKISDHRIIQPVEISISFIMEPENYRLTYHLIKQAFINALRFSVQTRTTTYTGMYISDIPHEEDPALFDTITMIIQFREVQIFRADVQELADVLDPRDASTVDRGQQTPGTPTDGQNDRGSTLFRVFEGLL